MKKILISFIVIILFITPVFSINVTNDVLNMTQIDDIGWSIFPVGAYMRFELDPRLDLIENERTDLYLDLFGGYKTGYSVGWNSTLNKKESVGFGKIESGWKLNFSQTFLKNKFNSYLFKVSVGNKTDMHIAMDYIGKYLKRGSDFDIANTDFSKKPYFKELNHNRNYLSTSFYLNLNLNYVQGSWGYDKGFNAYIDSMYGMGNLLDTSSKIHHYGSFGFGYSLYFPIYSKRYNYNGNEYNLVGITLKDSTSYNIVDGSYVPSNAFQSNFFNLSHSTSLNIMGPHILMYDTYPSLYLTLGQYYETGYETNTLKNVKSSGGGAYFNGKLDFKIINIVHLGYNIRLNFNNNSFSHHLIFYVKIV